MIVCYPNNPTGACAPDSFINDLIAFARKNNILVVYDNAYSDLVYTGVPGRSFLSFDHAIEVGVEINSFQSPMEWLEQDSVFFWETRKLLKPIKF